VLEALLEHRELAALAVRRELEGQAGGHRPAGIGLLKSERPESGPIAVESRAGLAQPAAVFVDALELESEGRPRFESGAHRQPAAQTIGLGEPSPGGLDVDRQELPTTELDPGDITLTDGLRHGADSEG
jgi:hypothetical protein